MRRDDTATAPVRRAPDAMTVRVLHYVDSDTFGGTEQSLLQLAEGLTPRGFESVVRCHQEPDLARLRAAADAKGLPIRQVPRSAAWKTPRLFRQLVREFESVRPTIVHVHMPWVLSCRDGIAAARLARVPIVIATVQLWIPERQSTIVHLKHRILTRWIARYIAVSRGIATQLRDEYAVPNDKIRVVYNAASIPPRRSSVSPDQTGRPLRVLTVARLHPQKALDDLIRAVPRVPGALFSIAGDGPERLALEECARRVGVADRVSFLGFRHDVPDLLDACDVFVLPSLFEGFPLVLLEAMAREKPIVATAVPGIEEVLDDGAGMTVPPRNPEALARAIIALAADPDRARRLAAKGRERVETRFSVEQMVSGVAQVYEDALREAAIPR